MGIYTGKAELRTNKPAYDITKHTEVTPKEESRETAVSIPTDPATLQALQQQIQQAQRTYGINPKTGTPTPFEVIGYKPEEERKRREAERELNDFKRKENAWYSALSVLGDSLTAALGGNVWQRQPNQIGARANADNTRLIAEQKAEDEANQAKLRSAGARYAETVNRLIQNYLTKTVTTKTAGGERTVTEHHPAIESTREVPLYNNRGTSGSGSGSGRTNKYININTTGSDGSITKNKYEVTDKQYRALQGILKEHYNSILSKSDEHSKNLMDFLTNAHVIKGVDSQGQYIYDNDQLLQNGYFWMLDDATRDRIEAELNGKVKFRRGSKQTPAAKSTKVWQGVEANIEPEDEDYDD